MLTLGLARRPCSSEPPGRGWDHWTGPCRRGQRPRIPPETRDRKEKMARDGLYNFTCIHDHPTPPPHFIQNHTHIWITHYICTYKRHTQVHIIIIILYMQVYTAYTHTPNCNTHMIMLSLGAQKELFRTRSLRQTKKNQAALLLLSVSIHNNGYTEWFHFNKRIMSK